MDQSTVLDNQFEKSARRVSFPFSIRFWYVPILALLAQSAIIRLYGADVVPEVFLRLSLISTFLFVLGVMALNIRLPGMRIMALGVLLNIIVIGSNGGLMPVSPETLDRVSPEGYTQTLSLGSPVQSSKDILLDRQDTNFWWLSDIFASPRFMGSWGIAFSIGDVLIAAGLLFFIISMLVRVWSSVDVERPTQTRVLET